MSSAKKLIAKVARRAKNTKMKARGNEYDKANKLPKIMSKSPRAEELMRKTERRADRAFGNDMIAQKPTLAKKLVAASMGRHDYGAGDYGTQLTLTAATEGYAGMGMLVGDLVQILQQNSAAYGQYLAVTAVTDSSHLRLEDTSSLAYAGAKETTSVTTVADSAGSLNSTYWLLSKPGTNYYVWYNVSSGGTDPAVGGRTGIPVAISTGATATAVATATKAALDAISGAWTTTQSTNHLTVMDQAVGTATDAADGTAATSFTIAITQQGAAANPTPTAQTNVAVRLEASSIKKQYR